MKSFQQFIAEADLKDKEGIGHGTGTTHRGGDKIGRDRKKTAPEKKRTKAIGGGKTAPAKDYKQRKDAGSQRPKGRTSERQQQPEKQRGSARLSMRDQQKKARAERMKANAGGKGRGDLKRQQINCYRRRRNQQLIQSINHKKQVDILHTKEERLEEQVKD